MSSERMTEQVSKRRYLELLSKKYPSLQSVITEITNLQAILNLPKGTEHFMSDLHGEYEAFYHIYNNCSGVIREKVDLLFRDVLSEDERHTLCTLIYYPEEKLEKLKREQVLTDDWYRFTLNNLVRLAKFCSSKYTRSKVRKAMPEEYRYIIDELLHAQRDEDNNQIVYHKKILDTLIDLRSGDGFIEATATLIKRLAVDHIHIVGDIFDRGSRPDAILDLLIQHPSIDIQWGNHDILWMGAAAGSLPCIATVVRNSLNYNNTEVLEKGYGISLRPLTLFAERTYPEIKDPAKASTRAISIMMLKLMGQTIQRHENYDMEDRLLFEKIDYDAKELVLGDKRYALKPLPMPTVDPSDPYLLTAEEKGILYELMDDFLDSEKLQKHVSFLYEKGSMYKSHNGNLLFHGCIPLREDGSFSTFRFGNTVYKGKAYMDFADRAARRAYYYREQEYLDFMWYLWCGKESPLSGRLVKTFERNMVEDESTWKEPRNAYYELLNREEICSMILREFGIFGDMAHIINGHTPVKVKKGESPIKGGGRLLVIDGGFCKAYQSHTGIAGYTLIYNSHGLRFMQHEAFQSMEKALDEDIDIQSESDFFEAAPRRVMVEDTDDGKKIQEDIQDLKDLLRAYREGLLSPRSI